jgi:hypothetical protein
MVGAVGILGGVVAMLALAAVLVRLLLIAALASLGGLAVTTLAWNEAGPFVAIATGCVTFILMLAIGISHAFGRWI